MKMKREGVGKLKLILGVFSLISIFIIASAIVNAITFIDRGANDWDKKFDLKVNNSALNLNLTLNTEINISVHSLNATNITVVGNINGTGDLNVSGNAEVGGILTLGTPLTDASIANDLTIQTTSELTVGGGFSTGGVTITTDGNIQTQDILIAGNITGIVELSVNNSIIPILDNNADLGNASNRFRNVFVGTRLNVSGTTIFRTTTDSTTGFVIEDADGGTPIFNVDTTNEKVGIGTTSPARVLHAVSSSDYETMRIERSGGGGVAFEFKNGDGNIGIVSLELDESIQFKTPTTSPAMVILDAGNVGIGTTDPEQMLELETSDTSGAQLQLTSTDTGGLEWRVISTGTSSTGGAGNLGFYDGGAYVLYLDGPTDNVGIGTTTPGRLLEVASGSAEGIARITGFEGKDAVLELWSDEGDNGGDMWNITSGGDSGNKLAFRTGSITPPQPEVMTLLTKGNVGINTTTPANTLTVQGTLNVTGNPGSNGDFIVDSSGNVGIGTAEPDEELVVFGNQTINATDGTGGMTLAYNGSGLCISVDGTC